MKRIAVVGVVWIAVVACGKGKKADIDPDEQPAIDFVVKGARVARPLQGRVPAGKIALTVRA
jgi:hypothetical protein